MSKGLLNSFKNGTIPETVKNTDEKVKEEVVATPVEPVKEESELDKLKRELEEARRRAEEAEGARDRALAEAKEAKKKTSSPKATEYYTKDATICIRLNWARKRFCKEMSKKIGVEGGIGGYINYLIAADMRVNPDIKALAESKEGKDFPYQSSREQSKTEYDENYVVEQHFKK